MLTYVQRNILLDRLFALKSDQKRKAFYAFAHYTYVNALEQGFLETVPGVDRLEFALQDGSLISDLTINDFDIANQSFPVRDILWTILSCLRESNEEISSFDIGELDQTVEALCGEPLATESIILSLAGIS